MIVNMMGKYRLRIVRGDGGARSKKRAGQWRRTNLALDLLACPPGSISRSAEEILVGTCFPCHSREEIVSEVLPKFAIGESLGKITTVD